MEGIKKRDPAKTCNWQQDDVCVNLWFTECDNKWYFQTYTPVNKGMRFCCFCGGALFQNLSAKVLAK